MIKQFKITRLSGLIFVGLFSLYAQNINVADSDPNRFQDEIGAILEWDLKNSYPLDAILFIGSSSIRLWPTFKDFPKYPIINRGFGGSHISDVNFFYDQLVLKYHPRVIVFYAGDNDIAAGKSVEQVYEDYLEFLGKILNDLPHIKIIYIPIKPSTSRWRFWPQMKEVNTLVEQLHKKSEQLYYIDTATALLDSSGNPESLLFIEDGLHLNEAGYALWKSLLEPLLERVFGEVKK
jgi:lysophospholipase L1-like esterase